MIIFIFICGEDLCGQRLIYVMPKFHEKEAYISRACVHTFSPSCFPYYDAMDSRIYRARAQMRFAGLEDG